MDSPSIPCARCKRSIFDDKFYCQETKMKLCRRREYVYQTKMNLDKSCSYFGEERGLSWSLTFDICFKER